MADIRAKSAVVYILYVVAECVPVDSILLRYFNKRHSFTDFLVDSLPGIVCVLHFFSICQEACRV